MVKRYLFWRTPDGRPYRGTDDKFAPVALLAEIGKSASVTSDGKISRQGFGIIRFEAVIRSTAVVLDSDGVELNPHDTWAICLKAINDIIKKSGGKSAVQPTLMLECGDQIAAEYFRNTKSDYDLVTSLSIKELPAIKLRVGKCELSSLNSRGTRYPFPIPALAHLSRIGTVDYLNTTKYQLVRIKTSGRTAHDATEIALEAINLLRGFWNLFATFGAWAFSFGSSKHKPLGVVHIGPVHTLHSRNSLMKDNPYWYEPSFIRDRDLFDPKDDWAKIEKNRRWCVRRIKCHKYRRELESLIVRYTLALDQSDLDMAFLQMWSILERLTNTVGANYDKTIERALWPFIDRDIGKEILEALRFRRNQLVHAAKSGEDGDQIAYMIKRFIEPHLIQLIRNDVGVDSLEEYGNSLALPTNIAALKDRRRQLARVIKILEIRAKRS